MKSKTAPLPLVYSVFAILFGVVVVITSMGAAREGVSDPGTSVAPTSMPSESPADVPTRSATVSTVAPTAAPAPTPSVIHAVADEARSTACCTAVPGDSLDLSGGTRMVRLTELEEPELDVPLSITEELDLRPPVITPSPMRITPIPPALFTPHPPALVGKALVVDQDAQMLRVYENGVEIRALRASTGVPPLYTPAFLGHVGPYVRTLYGYGGLADDAWYVFTARGNIYIHGAPYSISQDAKAYKGLEFLGVRPSSHGCIRLDPDDAQWLTAWNPQGVPILITPLDLDKQW